MIQRVVRSGRGEPAELGRLGKSLNVPQLQKMPAKDGARKPVKKPDRPAMHVPQEDQAG